MTAPIMDINAVIKEAAEAALPPKADEVVAPEATDDVPDDDSVEESDVADDDVADASDAEQVDEEADSAGDGDAIALPDGYVAVPSVTNGLATEFTLKDSEGEVEVPDLIVEYKANGKVRQDRLDQVVKLAQWGVYNQEREQQVAAAQQAVQERDQLAQLVAEREAQLERLLTDEDFLYSVREAYENENSPERRAQRAEERVQNMQVQQQMSSIEATGMQFLGSEIEPAIELISTALPTVSQEELASRIGMVMQAHAERAPNGALYVPASRYDAIRQYIVEDLAIWADAQHKRRRVPATPPKVDRELERARVEAQKAKRMVGQTMKPVGRAGRDVPPPRSAKPATIDDAVSSALNSVLSALN
jgi:hypothetical protein